MENLFISTHVKIVITQNNCILCFCFWHPNLNIENGKDTLRTYSLLPQRKRLKRISRISLRRRWWSRHYLLSSKKRTVVWALGRALTSISFCNLEFVFRIVSNNIIRSDRYSAIKFFRKFERCSQIHKIFSCCWSAKSQLLSAMSWLRCNSDSRRYYSVPNDFALNRGNALQDYRRLNKLLQHIVIYHDGAGEDQVRIRS